VSEKRRGLGRGLGALIPSNSTPPTRPSGERPVDVFFPGRGEAGDQVESTEDVAVLTPQARVSGLTGLPGARTADGIGMGTILSPAFAPTSRFAPESPLTTVDRFAAGVISTADPTPSEPDITTLATGSVMQADVPHAGTPDPGGSVAEIVSDGTDDAEDNLVAVPGVYFAELPVTAIRPNPKQPRQIFDEEALAELVHSIREIGVLQPVVVRRVADENGEARYELIMGERRLRATAEAGLDRIPAIVRETHDDALLRDALLENLHRSQLNALEEAAAYQQLLDDFGCTHEELAARIGRSRPQISNTLRLLKLPPLVQRRVAAGVLSAGHARALLGLEDSAGMERLAQRIVAEGLSVRAVEEIVAMGDGPVAKPAKRRPRAGGHTSQLDDLASRLGDRLDTRVAIALGRSKGRLSIDFASVDDLNRILGVLAPEVTGLFRSEV
jgi:ParB family chromosome partitioning protein